MARRGMLSGLALGMGLMYFLDPDQGKRRRALARDRFVGTINELSNTIEMMLRDAGNRLEGVLAEARGLVTQDDVSESQLVERVRATLGHYASHPRLIDVSAQRDRVVLSGPVLAREVDRLLSAVAAVRGVGDVENRLEVHDRPDVPALKGEHRAGRSSGPHGSTWSQSTQVVASLLGGGLVLRALRRPSLVNLPLGAVGLGLLNRAFGFLESSRSSGHLGTRRIDLQKTLQIKATAERVYELFTHPERFPQFMRNVRSVKDLGEGRSSWTVAGPMGAPVHFNAMRTQQIASELVAWKSEPGSPVQHTGTVRLHSNPDGSTRVDLRMTYEPPAGVAGHAVAALFGSDPKSEMDEDLLRMKTFLETGKEPHNAAAASRDV